ncbi:MAG: carboxypeptidase-like regulatory domain-containing protein [Pyrinomonadaceae bacterium]|nr:carboxypeptidase-like regulatory domain-containing protein [Pyrinomonadaceae bacterium]
MKIILALFIFLTLSISIFAQSSTCFPVKGKETTYWVGNLQVIFVEKIPLRNLHGTVVAPDGNTIENALVEIFTKPEYLLINKPIDKRGAKGQKRIFACRTRANGKFSFPNLRPGKYELRSSKDDFAIGWNATQRFIVVSPKGKKKEIRVEMSLGI